MVEGLSLPPEAAARLRAQPWEALEGLAPMLAGPLEAVLSAEPAERVLDRLLRAHRDFSAPQRQAVAEALFGIGLWRRRLQTHVGSSALPALLLFSLVHHLGGRPAQEARALAGLAPDAWLPEGPGPSCWEEALSVPQWLAAHLKAELGEAEALRFCAALTTPAPIFLRANLLATGRPELQERLWREGVDTVPTATSPWGLRVVGKKPNLWGLAAWREGLFEVQDEGSQLLGALVEARPGEKVLDACAGAGGKTLLLASAMQGQGQVDAYDVDAARLERLAVRAHRAHAPCVTVLKAAAEGHYDAVLVDAPCSQLGTLRRGPDMRFRLPPSVLTAHLDTQAGVLAQAAARVRPGGRLVYATCTVNRGENQAMAEAFERAHPAFCRLRPGEGWLPDAYVQEGFFLTLPHRHQMDGFFAAVYRRSQ
jgi:16S rRNA (cytosine967-C5)-methyltransferase